MSDLGGKLLFAACPFTQGPFSEILSGSPGDDEVCFMHSGRCTWKGDVWAGVRQWGWWIPEFPHFIAHYALVLIRF